MTPTAQIPQPGDLAPDFATRNQFGTPVDAASLSERTSLSLLTACLIYLSLLAAGEKQLNDSDTLWHIVLGRRILDTWRLPQADAFSFTFDGAPYQTNSWLSDVLLAAAYDIGGFAGVITLSTFCVSLTFFLLQREYLSSLSNKFSIYFCCAVFVLISRPRIKEVLQNSQLKGHPRENSIGIER